MNNIVTAMTRQDSCFSGVVLRRVGKQYELLHRYRETLPSGQWKHFREQLSQSFHHDEAASLLDQSQTIAGLDSAGVVFYQVTIPGVDSDSMEAVVTMQAEAILPLPLDQMTWAWRAGATHNGKVPLILAAAKSDLLEAQVRDIRQIKPSRIILDAEALVYGWLHFCGGHHDRALVVYLDADHTQLCLAQNGQMIGSIRLDQGRETFETSEGLAQQAVEQLAHDVRMALERFGGDNVGRIEVYFLSDGSETIRQMVDVFSQVNIDAHEALGPSDKLVAEPGFDTREFYQFLPAVALAAMATDAKAQPISLTEKVYSSSESSAPQAKRSSLWLWVLTVLVLLTTCLFVGFRSDARKVKTLRAALQQSHLDLSVNQFLKANQLRQHIGSQRIDLLELLETIHGDRVDGIVLDSIQFKRGQAVRLKGHVKEDNQKPYQFLEKLQNAPGISEAILEDPVYDKKKKEKSFTVTFHYKHFTKKKTVHGHSERRRL